MVKSIGFGVTLSLGWTLVFFIRPYSWLIPKKGDNSLLLPISKHSAMWLCSPSHQKEESVSPLPESGLSLWLDWPIESWGSCIANSKQRPQKSSKQRPLPFFLLLLFFFFFSSSPFPLLLSSPPPLSPSFNSQKILGWENWSSEGLRNGPRSHSQEREEQRLGPGSGWLQSSWV